MSIQSQNSITAGPRRHGYLVAGYILFGFGLIGAVLPVMPTTVFWIAAAACFARSSDRMYAWIIGSRLGPAIEDFLSQGAISNKSKAVAVTGMGFGLAIAVVTLGGGVPLMAALLIIGSASVYVLTRPVPQVVG